MWIVARERKALKQAEMRSHEQQAYDIFFGTRRNNALVENVELRF
jgi:hypothetical protein